jgi:hypothetical protein
MANGFKKNNINIFQMQSQMLSLLIVESLCVGLKARVSHAQACTQHSRQFVGTGKEFYDQAGIPFEFKI